MLVGKVAFDMENVAERAAVDDALEFAHGGEAALVVAAAKRNAGLAARRNGARSLAARQCEPLLAPDRLAGAGGRADLLDMQRMRRRQEDRLHLGVGDGI